MQTKIRAEFAKLDADNSGFITKGTKKSNINCHYHQRTTCLEEMLQIISAEFKDEKIAEAQAAIDKLDVDKDGKVSYPEFILVMKFKK